MEDRLQAIAAAGVRDDAGICLAVGMNMLGAGYTEADFAEWRAAAGCGSACDEQMRRGWNGGWTPDSDGDGKLAAMARRAGWRGGAAPSPRPQQPAAPPRPPEKPHQWVQKGEVTAGTLGELKDLKFWFVGAGKKLASWRGNCYRQSQPPSRGGVALARYGSAGRVVDFGGYELIVRPWDTYEKTVKQAGHWSTAKNPCRVSLSLAGDRETRPVSDLSVLDFDYSPEEDLDGWGRRYRDLSLERLAGARVPCYRSGGGHGFHGLINAARPGEKWLKWLPREPKSGARLEVFAPGSKKLLAFFPDRPMDGAAMVGDEARIPAMGWGGLLSVLRGS